MKFDTVPRFLADLTDDFKLRLLDRQDMHSLISDALTETGRWHERRRKLLAPIVVWFVLLLSIFRSLAIPDVFKQLLNTLREKWNELDVFAREFQKRSYRYFVPDGQLQHEITMVCDQGFAIHQDGRQESFCFFRDWMDWKFFR